MFIVYSYILLWDVQKEFCFDCEYLAGAVQPWAEKT